MSDTASLGPSCPLGDDHAAGHDSGYAALSHQQLVALAPELLLSGQLIDRSGMAHLISAFGRETMTRVAIEEWMASSPVYTSRMRTALGIDGDGVEDMFKCMQYDIGAPPQFMDFRYEVTDKYHGAFVLDHCGALMDVEPLGDEYVTAMCHDIEDPTFDATAIATNRRARIRPIHRPPRVPADRTPHCAWTVSIEPDRPELPLPEDAEHVFTLRAANVDLSPIDPQAPDGFVDYRGPLHTDLQFRDWSHSALVRICEELALQHQLLALGFQLSLRRYAESEEQTDDIYRKQLTGISGLTAARLVDALNLPADAEGLAQVLALHPVLGPQQYTGVVARVDDDAVVLRIPAGSGAQSDGGWIRLLTVDHLEPLQAIATAVDPYLTVSAEPADDGGVQVRFVRGDEKHREADEVAIVRFSSGSSFHFADRGPTIPLSITPLSTNAAGS